MSALFISEKGGGACREVPEVGQNVLLLESILMEDVLYYPGKWGELGKLPILIPLAKMS